MPNPGTDNATCCQARGVASPLLPPALLPKIASRASHHIDGGSEICFYLLPRAKGKKQSA